MQPAAVGSGTITLPYFKGNSEVVKMARLRNEDLLSGSDLVVNEPWKRRIYVIWPAFHLLPEKRAVALELAHPPLSNLVFSAMAVMSFIWLSNRTSFLCICMYTYSVTYVQSPHAYTYSEMLV